MTDDETVYMNRGGQSRVYHTRADCSYLPNDPTQVRQVDRDAVEPHYSECEICAGEHPFGGWDHGNGSTNVYDAAEQIDPGAWDQENEL